jgi:hypothetical protein
MTIKTAIFAIAAFAFAPAVVGCASTPANDTVAEVKTVDHNGIYKNGAGGTLTISNFVAGSGFDFGIKIVSDDDCGGVEYAAAVEFTDATSAKNGQEDSFTIGKDAITFEPSGDMIGMACQRFMDVSFSKQD